MKYKKIFSSPNIWGLETEKEFKRGDVVEIENRFGETKKHIVFNFIRNINGLKHYSIVREDGYNNQKKAEKKAEKFSKWENSAVIKSENFYKKSQEGKDFLILGEPIKIGHHSEKKHRALIKKGREAMTKTIEMDKKAEDHKQKAEFWEKKIKKIDLTMPESLEFFKKILEKAEERKTFLKNNPEKREHSYSLTYANNDVRKNKKLLEKAIILWE